MCVTWVALSFQMFQMCLGRSQRYLCLWLYLYLNSQQLRQFYLDGCLAGGISLSECICIGNELHLYLYLYFISYLYYAIVTWWVSGKRHFFGECICICVLLHLYLYINFKSYLYLQVCAAIVPWWVSGRRHFFRWTLSWVGTCTTFLPQLLTGISLKLPFSWTYI